MRKTTTSLAIAFAISGATGAFATAASAAPNQGDVSKVIVVTNGAVSCPDPLALDKVDGSIGTTIDITSSDPISFVTVKSGRDAYLVSSTFTATGATITISKDVSNYIVWTCALGGGGSTF